jgi:hypothetical protein
MTEIRPRNRDYGTGPGPETTKMSIGTGLGAAGPAVRNIVPGSCSRIIGTTGWETGLREQEDPGTILRDSGTRCPESRTVVSNGKGTPELYYGTAGPADSSPVPILIPVLW